MLALILSVALAAAPWPAKGDTVYVSATLTNHVNPVSGIFGPVTSGSQTPVAACTPLTVTKAKPSLWDVRDPSGGYERLEGAWLQRLHRTESECAALAAQGEPSIVRNGWRHILSK
jgi:hypothetical protein